MCGADITNFLVEAIKTLPETTEEEQMMKAFSMFAPMMMMSQFAALAKTSVVMEMACTGPSENEFCWSKEWFFDAAMDSDSNDEGDDDSNDDCSYPPSASEACASLPTDDAFCSAPELSDCCATTAMVALNTVRSASPPCSSLLSHMKRKWRLLRWLTLWRVRANAGYVDVDVPFHERDGEHDGRHGQRRAHAVRRRNGRYLQGRREHLHPRQRCRGAGACL